jgi:hypothetical protein
LSVAYPFTVTTSGYEDGGSPLVSLKLQWDNGSAGATWTTLLGESPYATTDSYTQLLNPDGSNAGTTYKFRYAAYNIHGWGPYSPEANILAADVPGVIASTTIQLTGGTSVQFSWQSPETNGSPISAYKVEILTSTSAYAEETEYCSGSVDP